jgi:ankyrin repeat protein
LELTANSTQQEKDFLLYYSNQTSNGRRMDSTIGSLLSAGAGVNVRLIFGHSSPLHLACELNNRPRIIYLCENGADATQVPTLFPLHRFIPMAPGYGKINVLHYAVMQNDLSFVKLLVERSRMPIDERTEMLGETALFLALSQPEIFEYLLKAGAGVNVRNRQKEIVLHQAASNGRLDAARLLIQHGANCDALDDSQQTPIKQSIRHSHFEITRLLLAKNAHFESEYDREFYACLALSLRAPDDLVELIQAAAIGITNLSIEKPTAVSNYWVTSITQREILEPPVTQARHQRGRPRLNRDPSEELMTILTE